MATLESLPADADTEDVSSALVRDGGAIITGIADSYPEALRRLMGYQTHGPYLGVFPDDPDGHWNDA